MLCRSAGTSATLAAREADWAQINLPSGEIRRVPAACRATVGAIGNSEHDAIVIGKAGRNRWKGIRPHVRGTAMNPTDHPHGGGEGRTKGGRNPVSPEGKPAKGGSTRKRVSRRCCDRASPPFASPWPVELSKQKHHAFALEPSADTGSCHGRSLKKGLFNRSCSARWSG